MIVCNMCLIINIVLNVWSNIMPVIGHTLGFPRIGLYRELKYALEQYWNGKINRNKLLDIGYMLRMRHWKQQIDAGINIIPVGDFAWYDHVLTTSAMINNIPTRHYDAYQGLINLDTLFKTARGYSNKEGDMITPSEMKKWFNTNYHYIVPEFTKNQVFKLNWTQLFSEIDEASSLNHVIKPILLGPISYLWLGKIRGNNFNKLSLLPSLISVYQEILNLLSEKDIEWVQIDEPILVLELPKEWQTSYFDVYQKLYNNNIKLLLTTYFDGIYHQINTIKALSVHGLHVDLISNSNNISILHEQLPKNWVLSAGIVDGRNIWKTDLYSWFCKLRSVVKKRTLWIGSSCSLLHVPIDLQAEIKLSNDIKTWFAFALQKCSEIKMLCDALNNTNSKSLLNIENMLKQYYVENKQRFCSSLVSDLKVQKRCKNDNNLVYDREIPYAQRALLQHNKLKLPLYPTTTIGSFPQTQEIRNLRLDFKNGRLNSNNYNISLKNYIQKIILEQEKLGLDVLVHGEPERNDMVEYFGEHLKGFIFTQNGWVQSYGSRCAKPPVIIGDISRPKPITVQWIKYAQSLTNKLVKGILTGPITMLLWSFVRNDIPYDTIALQLALAIRDEVIDLEKSGVGIIQIDEPALREGLPLKKSDQQEYLNWSINAFKLTVSLVKNDTQIHTHMCYSEFDEVMSDILRLDADVISIESSRSDETILRSIHNLVNCLNEIGPGIYDIHSINIPSIPSLVDRLNQFLKYIPKERLWINPDCGLKTRSWDDIVKALSNMVFAAKSLREQ